MRTPDGRFPPAMQLALAAVRALSNPKRASVTVSVMFVSPASSGEVTSVTEKAGVGCAKSVERVGVLVALGVAEIVGDANASVGDDDGASAAVARGVSLS